MGRAIPILALLGACGHSAPPPSPVVVAIPSSEPTTTPAIADSHAADAAPPADVGDASTSAPAHVIDVALPDPAACRFELAAWEPFWRGEEGAKVALKKGGAAFAIVRGGTNVSLTLPVGSAADVGGILEVDTRDFLVRGVVRDADAVPLHAVKAFEVGGVVVPTAAARLAWTKAEQEKVTLRVEDPEGVVPIAALEASRACGDVNLEGAEFDPLAAIGGAGQNGSARLAKGRPTALARTPGGARVAVLTAAEDYESEVVVIAKSGAFTHIAWSRPTALVHGWVATSQLQKAAAQGGVGYGTGRGRLPEHLPREVLACPNDVTLLAEAGGERMRVGFVHARAPIGVVSRDATHAEVRFRRSTAQGADGARWLVPLAELRACAASRW